MEATFVVVGGGIAGVTCVETLAFYQPDLKIILISESSLIKAVANLLALTQNLSQFNVVEKEINWLTEKYPNVTVVHDRLIEIKDLDGCVLTESGGVIKYKYLCLCSGAKPKLIPHARDNPYVIGIRDTDSVDAFLGKLKKAKRVVIVGNGGIASELVYKICKVEVEWVIKDKHMTATFVDPGAAEFLRHKLLKNQGEITERGPSKRMKYECEGNVKKSGAALGPDWYKDLNIQGALESDSVRTHFQCEIVEVNIKNGEEFPVEIILSNNEVLRCDFIVSATGVEARDDFTTTSTLTRSNDKGIEVDEYLRTSIPNVYAAGDICSPTWTLAKHWFPMKLWTQARQMGAYAAKSMSCAFNNEEILQDFCFEIFTHTTKLFGFKVVLLGLYNGQKLGSDYEILFRMTEKEEYIKLVLVEGRLQGAVLIGDTDLEEMCENLILNQIDVSQYKEDLLNPDIDIEDYFD